MTAHTFGASDSRAGKSAGSPLPDLAQMPLFELLHHLVPPVELAAVVTRALNEDLGNVHAWDGIPTGDVTTQVMVAGNDASAAQVRGAVRARGDGVVAGVPVALEVLRQVAPGVRVGVHVQDGERVQREGTILSLDGPVAQILTAERTLLNFMGLLSGVATATARMVEAIKGTRATICCTRKTIPGLRALQKYAVRCGGGTPHRLGLYDAVLIKDNHLAAVQAGPRSATRGGNAPVDVTTPASAPGEPARSGAEKNPTSRLPAMHAFAEAVAAAAARARQAAGERPLRFVMVECDTLDQFDALLALPAGVVEIALLDNMGPEDLRTAVNRRDAAGSPMLLEASGGVNLANVMDIAQAGVDRISVGAITHSAPWLDVGLDVDDPAWGTGERAGGATTAP